MQRYLKKALNGYLHARGRRIYNDAGEEVILCGVGIGNWMNPEGFMISGLGGMYGFTGMEDKFINNIRYDRGRTMNDAIRELCGSEYAKAFWPRWYRCQFGEADIRDIAQSGYNSVRLCLDASGFLYEEPGIAWNEDTFEMLDEIIGWCEAYGIYAILDLHAAPGGQSGVSCDNGLDNTPRLFLEPESYERAIVLWEKLADRYKDCCAVGGYELLNEPISTPQWHYLKPQLRKFYEDTIDRIRKIDKRHMVILQPPAFAHDMSFFDKGFDGECHNWCYSVHMYDSTPHMSDFYPYLEPSMRLDVPVWLGEGGCSNKAMSVYYDMLAEHGVGFCVFAWKAIRIKEETQHGIYCYEQPEGWDRIAKYIGEGGPRPDYAGAQEIFDRLLESCRFENCTRCKDTGIYCMRQQGIVLAAAGYDSYGGNGVSFSGGWNYGNVFSYRLDDHMKMVLKPGGTLPSIFDEENGPKPLENLLLELAEGEFAKYTVYRFTSKCRLSFSAMAVKDAAISVSCGEQETLIEIEAGGGIKKYDVFELECADQHQITVKAVKGIVQLEYFYFPL